MFTLMCHVSPSDLRRLAFTLMCHVSPGDMKRRLVFTLMCHVSLLLLLPDDTWLTSIEDSGRDEC